MDKSLKTHDHEDIKPNIEETEKLKQQLDDKTKKLEEQTNALNATKHELEKQSILINQLSKDNEQQRVEFEGKILSKLESHESELTKRYSELLSSLKREIECNVKKAIEDAVLEMKAENGLLGEKNTKLEQEIVKLKQEFEKQGLEQIELTNTIANLTKKIDGQMMDGQNTNGQTEQEFNKLKQEVTQQLGEQKEQKFVIEKDIKSKLMQFESSLKDLIDHKNHDNSIMFKILLSGFSPEQIIHMFINKDVSKLLADNKNLAEIALFSPNIELRNPFETLDLSKLNLGPDLTLILTPYIKPCKKLILKGNNIGSVGMKYLSEWDCSGNLTYLDLRSNNIGDEGLKYLLISNLCNQLTHLDISDNNIEFQALTDLVKTNNFNKLTCLRLSIVDTFNKPTIKQFTSLQDFSNFQAQQEEQKVKFQQGMMDSISVITTKAKTLNLYQLIHTIETPDNVYCCLDAIIGDKMILITSQYGYDYRGSLFFWDLNNLSDPIKQLNTIHEGAIRTLLMLNWDGKQILVSGSGDKTIKLWDLSDPEYKLINTIKDHKGSVGCLVEVYSSEVDYLISSGDKEIIGWEIEKKQVLKKLWTVETDVGPVLGLNLQQDTCIYSGHYSGHIKKWKLTITGLELLYTTADNHKHAIWISDMIEIKNNEERYIVSCGYGYVLKVWKANDLTFLFDLSGHTNNVGLLRKYLSEGKEYLISGSDDKSIIIWDITMDDEEKRIVQTLSSHNDYVCGLATIKSFDGNNFLVSGSTDTTIKIWKL